MATERPGTAETARLSEDEIVAAVEWVRAKNNRAWMGILRIALAKAPEETKELLRQVTGNDARISILLTKIAGEL